MRQSLQNRKWIIATIVVVVASGITARQRYHANTAALVNGERISIAPIAKQIERLRAHDEGRFDGVRGEGEEKRVRRLLLDSRVELLLGGQAAAKDGVKVTEAEIDAGLAQRAGIFKNEAEFYADMADQGLSGRTLRDEMRDSLLRTKMIVKLAREAKVSPGEVTNFIGGDKERLEAETKQAHLLWVTVSNEEQAAKLLAQGRTTGLATAAKREGLAVTELWQQESLIDPRVFDILALVGDGKMSDPLPNFDGTHSIFQITERKVRKSTGDELYRQVEDKLLRDKRKSSFQEWLSNVKNTSTVEIFI